MNIQELLTNAGLGVPEARLYLALYKLQEAQTGVLAKVARVPTSKIYEILEKLTGKGLVSYRVQNNVKIFQAAPPEALATLIEKKERELAEQKELIVNAIVQIKQTKPIIQPQSNYKYFEGVSGIKSLWTEVAQNMHDDTLRIHTGRQESYQQLAGFYSEFHAKRTRKKIPAKIIFPKGDTQVSILREKEPQTQVRYDDLRTLTEISVINAMVIIQRLGKNPHGFLIQDEEFANTFKEMFEKIWKQAQ